MRREAAMIPNANRMFNFDLGETADAIRETVHAFSQNEIAPRATEIDRSNQFPRDLWPKIGALGPQMGISGEIDGSVHEHLPDGCPAGACRRGDVLPYYIPSRAPAQGRVGCIWPHRHRRRPWVAPAHFGS